MQKNSVVAVIFGGKSCENEISIITGTLVCSILKKLGENVFPVYLSQDGRFFGGEELASLSFFKNPCFKRVKRAIFTDGCLYLLNAKDKIKDKIKVDCAINCCHGGWAEGGGISGLLQCAQIPFASAGVGESAVFMDKYLTKLFCRSLGVKTAPYVYLKSDYDDDQLKLITYPAIVKPATLGSSIGVQKVDGEQELKNALDSAFCYDDGVIIEKFFVDKREINCACYMTKDGVVTGELEEVFSKEYLSYDDKYSGNGKRVMPAEIDQKTANKIKTTAIKIYKKFNMRGIVRFDFILHNNDVYLCEGNTVPGSLANYLLSQNHGEFANVLKEIIALAKSEFESAKKKTLLNTGILNNFMPSNACKMK